MRRDLKKNAEEAKDFLWNTPRDIKVTEIKELLTIVEDYTDPDNQLDAILTAFYFGASVGARHEKAKAAKRKAD